MINIAALALLVSSLAAAGVWSPPPDNPHLIREGHRLIVVEYERHIPSDQAPPPPKTSHGVIGETKDRFQEASSLLPNVGQGIATPESADGEMPAAHSAKDLICDAYGSCKEKISHAFHTGKDRITRKASDIEESAADAVDRAKEKASDVTESVKERASEIQESAKDAVKSKMEGAKDAVKGKVEGAKDAVRSKMDSTKDAVRSTVESAKDAVKSAADVARDAEHDLSGNVSRAAGQAVDRAEEAAYLLRRNLTDIMNRAKDVAIDAAKNVGAPATARAAASIAHLMAFAVAYGTCVWVTFVSSHVLATALPRQQFGMVQSKLYPVYFQAMAYGVGIACLGHFFARERVVGVERVQGYNLLAALGLVLVNMFYLEPKATKVMFERMKIEKEEGRGRDMADMLGDTTPVMTASTATTTTATTQSASTFGIGMTKTTVTMDQEAVKGRAAKMNKRLRKLNGYSSFVNILTLMSLTWHLVHLGRRLQMTCTSV